MILAISAFKKKKRNQKLPREFAAFRQRAPPIKCALAVKASFCLAGSFVLTSRPHSPSEKNRRMHRVRKIRFQASASRHGSGFFL